MHKHNLQTTVSVFNEQDREQKCHVVWTLEDEYNAKNGFRFIIKIHAVVVNKKAWGGKTEIKVQSPEGEEPKLYLDYGRIVRDTLFLYFAR